MKQIAQNALLSISRREARCVEAMLRSNLNTTTHAYWDMERAKAAYIRLRIQYRFNVSMI